MKALVYFGGGNLEGLRGLKSYGFGKCSPSAKPRGWNYAVPEKDISTEVGTKSPAHAKKRVQISDNALPGGCLDNALRKCVGTVPDLTPSWTQALYWTQRRPCAQSMRSQEILPRSSTIGLPSELRVRADTNAVQDFWCPPP